MGEPNEGGRIKHDDPNEFPKVAIVERLTITKGGVVAKESVSVVVSDFDLKIVSRSQARALVVVILRAVLQPDGLVRIVAPEKIETLVERRIDVAGPEQSNVAMIEHVLMRPAFEAHVDIMRRLQSKSGRALEFEGRCGFLMELNGLIVESGEIHRRIAWLKENFAIERWGSVKDVFEVESSVCGHEEVSIQCPVFQAPNPIVPRAMVSLRFIVSNDSRQITNGKAFMHERTIK